MEFSINTKLDKIKVKEESKQEIIEIIKRIGKKITKSKLFEKSHSNNCIEYVAMDDNVGIICEIGEEGNLNLSLEITKYESKEILEAIYKVFRYMEILTNSKEQWSIEITYSLDKEDKKFGDVIRYEKLEWNSKDHVNTDILDILKYIAIDRCGDSNIRLKNAYLELENELK